MKQFDAKDIKINQEEAKVLIKNLCSDFGLDTAQLIFASNPALAGEYIDGKINIYSPNTGTLLHEFCHHLEAARFPLTERSHGVNFHRICFEVRDWIRNSYGVDYYNINSYEHTKGYEKALYEWRKSHNFKNIL